MAFCTECGDQVGAQTSEQAPGDDHGVTVTGAADDEATRPSRWPLWIAGAALALVVLGGAAARLANGADNDSRSETPHGAIVAPTTEYGCEVVEVRGLEAALVDPPYCTNVHAIGEFCGWSLDEIQVPPTTSPYKVRFERIGTYGFATFGTDNAGTVSLTCFAGDGPYDEQMWTAEQWRALNRPA